MLLSLLIILVITAGGFALTYLIENEEPFLWRVAAGNVIGCAVFGTIAFVLAMVFGLSSSTVAGSLFITLLPLVLLLDQKPKKAFAHDWARAKGKLQGANLKKALPFFYYAGFIILFVFFFDRGMVETAQGIFTGGSNNLGDLPFHLGAIFSFADGANFPPQNPNFAGAKFSYPFIADLVTACFLKFGIGVRDAMVVQNVSWAFSLLVLLERFAFRLIENSFAAKLAPPLLFFSGGLGFIWFFGDFGAQSKSFFDFLNALPKDYTVGDEFRWGNSLITLFLTQRSFLIGMPITLMALGLLWKIFAAPGTEEKKEDRSWLHFVPAIVIGAIAGLLPLIHLHSLVVLFVVTGFLLLIRLDRWKDFVAFGVGVCLIAVPELIWSMAGSATRATEFFAWHFGFDARETNIVWFWIKNTGLLFPMVAFSVYVCYVSRSGEASPDHEKKGKEAALNGRRLLLFYIPFLFLFVVSNIAKLAPWEWDNIKVLIYWFVGSLPFVSMAIAWMWRQSAALKAAAVVCFIVLIASGVIDVWRTVSRQINYRVFEADAVTVADRIKASTRPNALFVNAPAYNTAIVLSGRRSIMRYPGHLSSHGIDYRQREDDVKQIYRGGPNAVALIEKYGIEYLLISPEERANLGPNEAFFSRYPVVAESGQYRVYKVK